MKLLIIAFIASLAAFILLFPVPLTTNNCCIAEILYSQITSTPACLMCCSQDCHAMAASYMWPWGLMWWTSIVVIYFSGRKLLKIKRVKFDDKI